MRLRNSLRRRVTVGFVASGVLTSALFAIAVHIWAHDMELRFIDATTGEQLRYVIDQIERNPDLSLPATATMRGYVTTGDKEGEIPPYLRRLTPGTYERTHDGHELHIMVQDAGGRRYYLVYDATQIEPFEAIFHHFLIVGAAGFSLLTLLLGFWLSGRVVTPVTNLARQIQLSRADDDHGVDLSEFGNDEVGELARTFNAYAERLRGFAHREAEFTAEMSHELRNYIFVMGSSVELLIAEGSARGQAAAQLDRLKRGIHEMGALLDVIMILAREPRPPEPKLSASPIVEEVLGDVLESRQPELMRRNIRLQINNAGDAELQAPAPVLRAVLCNLLDNAIRRVQDGEITICLDEMGVTVIETGEHQRTVDRISAVEEPEHRPSTRGNEKGMSFGIVKRLCQRYGWQLEAGVGSGQPLQSRLLFSCSQKIDEMITNS